MIFSKLSYLVLILIAVVISSGCNEDSPLNQNETYKLDTSVFRWEATPIPFNEGFVNGLWASDTDEVFACNPWKGGLLHIKGSQVDIIYYSDSIRFAYIDGISSSQGYLVCVVCKDNLWQPAIKEWVGNAFVDLPLIHNFKKDFSPTSFYVKNAGEMWIGNVGLVHKFDGTYLTQYYLNDSSIIPVSIFSNVNGVLSLLGSKYIDTIKYDYIYEFDGNEWIKTYEDVNLAWFKFYGVMNDFVYAYNYPNIYKIENGIITAGFKLTQGVRISVPFAGDSFNDLMACGGLETGTPGIVYWNGNKWSDEKINDPNVFYGSSTYLQKVNNNFYCGFIQDVSFPYFIRGFRKIK